MSGNTLGLAAIGVVLFFVLTVFTKSKVEKPTNPSTSEFGSISTTQALQNRIQVAKDHFYLIGADPTLASEIVQAAREFHVSPYVIAATCWQESGFTRYETNGGPFQVQPIAFKQVLSKFPESFLSVDGTLLNNPLMSARVAAAYWRWLMDVYGDRNLGTLAGYYRNGPGQSAPTYTAQWMFKYGWITNKG